MGIIEIIEGFINGDFDTSKLESLLEKSQQDYIKDGDGKYFKEKLKDHLLITRKDISQETWEERYNIFNELKKKYL